MLLKPQNTAFGCVCKRVHVCVYFISSITGIREIRRISDHFSRKFLKAEKADLNLKNRSHPLRSQRTCFLDILVRFYSKLFFQSCMTPHMTDTN